MNADSDKNRIVISAEDVQDARVLAVTQHMKSAEQYALVREVGSSASAPRGGITAIAVLVMVGAGLAGGLLAFLGNEISDSLIDWESNPVWMANLTFTFIMAFAIGLTLVVADAGTQRNWTKLTSALALGVPISIAAALCMGGIAHLIYSPWSQAIYSEADAQANLGLITSQQQYYDFIIARLHLARGIAWSLVGLSAGLTIGISSRSLRRVLITSGGGLVGGFLGGFFFDYFTGENSARISGMIITGLLVGLAMSLLEQASKTRWIEIVSGGMAGKQFILYKSDLTIGSSPRADITLIKDPGIADLAARLVIQGSQAVLESLSPTNPVAVNGQVASRTTLSDGSQVNLGSSVIRYREKSTHGKAPSGGPTRLG